MVRTDLFMTDYLTLKAEISQEVDKAETAVINMAISNGYNIDDATKDSIVNQLVAKSIGEKYIALKFYEKYIEPDVADENVSEEVE